MRVHNNTLYKLQKLSAKSFKLIFNRSVDLAVPEKKRVVILVLPEILNLISKLKR